MPIRILILRRVQSKFFLAENVSGMLANRYHEAVQNIIRLFEESGYNVTLTLVNAKDSEHICRCASKEENSSC